MIVNEKIGNCDTFLYLGGNEQSTHEYISKMLGKETIDTRTRGVTKGQHGSSNTNYQNTGRELMTLDEVRLLDNSNALIFIRGEKPIMDKKFDILSHPNIKFTEDDGAKPYKHSKDKTRFSDDIHITDPNNAEIIGFDDDGNAFKILPHMTEQKKEEQLYDKEIDEEHQNDTEENSQDEEGTEDSEAHADGDTGDNVNGDPGIGG